MDPKDRSLIIAQIEKSKEKLNAAKALLKDGFIADRNASSDWARFSPVADGLKGIDRDRVFARYWTHPQDVYEEMSHKSEKYAEMLVPDCIRPTCLLGAYVANEKALQKFQQLNISLPVSIRNDIFF